MRYKCIIFDCDGILVDSEMITCKILVAMAHDLGISIDMDYAVENFVGKSLNQIMIHLDKQIDSHLPLSFEAEYRQRTYSLFKKELRPIEGIEDLLEKIKVPFCVASSGPLKKIELNLGTTNLLHRFHKNLFSCYEIKSWKPNPDIFLHAAKEMGFLPHECAVVEDSPTGVKAALAGGFDVFMYTKEKNAFSFHKKVTVFEHMADLPGLWS